MNETEKHMERKRVLEAVAGIIVGLGVFLVVTLFASAIVAVWVWIGSLL